MFLCSLPLKLSVENCCILLISIPKYELYMYLNGHGLCTKVYCKYLPIMSKGNTTLAIHFIIGGVSMLEVINHSRDTSINKSKWTCVHVVKGLKEG